MPGGKPVIAEPGLTPTFPLITVEPVLVTVEPARTPKLPAVNRDGACAWLGEVRAVAPIRPSTATAPRTPARFSDDVRTNAGVKENLLIRLLPHIGFLDSQLILNRKLGLQSRFNCGKRWCKILYSAKCCENSATACLCSSG